MRLFEFPDSEMQICLWELITFIVWQAIAKQEQERLSTQKSKPNTPI
jgi:hypothetical protein